MERRYRIDTYGTQTVVSFGPPPETDYGHTAVYTPSDEELLVFATQHGYRAAGPVLRSRGFVSVRVEAMNFAPVGELCHGP